MFTYRLGIFVPLLLGTAVAAAGAAVGSETTVDERLESLLERDAESQTDERLRNLLEFCRSAGAVPESTWQRPEWRALFESVPWDDPFMLAPFLEIGVRDRPMTLSPETRELIQAHQSEALAAAVRLSQNGFSPVARMAADVLMQHRDQLTADHWQSILAGRQYVIRHRKSYPAGIHAHVYGYSLIPLGYVFISNQEARILTTETKVYFDEKQKYPRGTKGLGWRADSGYIGFGSLSVGPHTLQLKTTYELKLGDVAVTGVNTSPEYHVEITAADTPDHLAAEVDEQLIARVEAGVVVGSKDEAREFTYSRKVAEGKFKPTVRILVPAIKVAEPLPVTLCMKPEIYVEGEDKPLTRYAWIVPAGRTSTRILENWVGDPRLSKLLRKAGDAEGRLPAKLVLRPSREEALSNPSIEEYYPRVIEREIEFRWREPEADGSSAPR